MKNFITDYDAGIRDIWIPAYNKSLDFSMWENSSNWENDILWKNDIAWQNSINWQEAGWKNTVWNSFYVDENPVKNETPKPEQKPETTKPINKEVKMKGSIDFAYILNTNLSFRKNWDDRVLYLTKALNKTNVFWSNVDIDSGEYDRSKNLIKGIISFEIQRFGGVEISNEKSIIEYIHDNTVNVRKNYDINFNEIKINLNTGIKSIFNVNNGDNYISKPVEVPKTKSDKENVLQSIVNALDKISKDEEKKPAFVKILDETKKRFRKKTFEIIKEIKDIDGIPVNCYVAKQIRGDKNRQRYTLNPHDCEVIGIEYRENLEILPIDLKFEAVYKKVKNE